MHSYHHQEPNKLHDNVETMAMGVGAIVGNASATSLQERGKKNQAVSVPFKPSRYYIKVVGGRHSVGWEDDVHLLASGWCLAKPMLI
jgi:hypothetical protein